MNPLYNFGIRAYAFGAKVLATRKEKVRKMLDGQKATFERLSQRLDPSRRYVWIHASSLGEFEQGRPLIEMIRRERPDCHVVLSFFSPSGYEVRHDYAEADAVVYLPFDLPKNAERFIDIVKPEMAIFVKYEFWGNYLSALHRRGIPTYIISSIFRRGQIFFRPWGGMFRKMLRCFTHIYVQDDASRSMLADIGVTNVTVAGDTRFDRVTDILANVKEVAQAEAIAASAKVTVVAGSTWPADERFLLPYFNAHDDVKLIIAPHEVNEERVAEILAVISRKAVRLSQATPEQAAQADCLVVDCFGMLSSIYHFGDVAYIGGGFGAGIHNINEAAVHSIPVVFGPKHEKFKEASDLLTLGGAFSFIDNEGFTKIFDDLTSDTARRHEAGETAGKYIADNLGATRRIFDEIFVNA
ncbi:MAG: 3-deoxy-D-manno-octulosonic acid transferase [Muribaculaceae bacterium]|nr:3-deoxy-D-manno-octulosonic acid transferase [Muribaculaceae bacterium]